MSACAHVVSGVSLGYWAALTTSEERKLAQFDESASLIAVTYELDEEEVAEYARLAIRVRVCSPSSRAHRASVKGSPWPSCSASLPSCYTTTAALLRAATPCPNPRARPLPSCLATSPRCADQLSRILTT